MQWSVSVLLTIRQFRSPTSFIINLQHGQEIRAEEKSLSMSRHERPHWTGTLITNRRRTHLKHSIHLSIPVHLTGQKKKKKSLKTQVPLLQSFLWYRLLWTSQFSTLDSILGLKKKKKKRAIYWPGTHYSTVVVEVSNLQILRWSLKKEAEEESFVRFLLLRTFFFSSWWCLRTFISVPSNRESQFT